MRAVLITILLLSVSMCQAQKKQSKKEIEADSVLAQAKLDSVCASQGHDISEWLITAKTPVEQVNRSADSLTVELFDSNVAVGFCPICHRQVSIPLMRSALHIPVWRRR